MSQHSRDLLLFQAPGFPRRVSSGLCQAGKPHIDPWCRPALCSQGYAFKVITALEGIEDTEDLVYKTKSEQIELLQSVLLANESEADLGSDMKDVPGDLPTYSMPGASSRAATGGAGKATRVAGSLQALAG